jgi:hypothetical protein
VDGELLVPIFAQISRRRDAKPAPLFTSPGCAYIALLLTLRAAEVSLVALCRLPDNRHAMGIPARLRPACVGLLCPLRGWLLPSQRGPTVACRQMAALASVDTVYRALGLCKDDQASAAFVKEPRRRPLRPRLDPLRLFPQPDQALWLHHRHRGMYMETEAGAEASLPICKLDLTWLTFGSSDNMGHP